MAIFILVDISKKSVAKLAFYSAFGTKLLIFCHLPVFSLLGFHPVSILSDEGNKSIYGVFLCNPSPHTLLSFVEINFVWCASYIAIISVGHLSGAIYNTSHDAYLEVGKVACRFFDAGNCSLQIIERTPTSRAANVLGVGESKTSRL
jgi:hypothetical protein